MNDWHPVLIIILSFVVVIATAAAICRMIGSAHRAHQAYLEGWIAAHNQYLESMRKPLPARSAEEAQMGADRP